MNILYLTHLNDNMSQGPNYSVPAQIAAQARFDQVFWWNLTTTIREEWRQIEFFHTIEEFPKKKISSLPYPFSEPDLVVFEGFYHGDEFIFSAECRKRGIPYIIIPRSCLTKSGQRRKWYKKAAANLLLFNRVCKNAASIQYLTQNEYLESGKTWNRHYCIIPNGIDMTDIVKTDYSVPQGINGIYVGRFEPYQKGLDLLLQACRELREELVARGVVIYLHGPERMGCREEYRKQIIENQLDDILVVADGVFGDEKKETIRNGDFFLMTSRFEGLPMALIEAMSCGVPCAVTDGTNMADVIREHDAGWTCETSVNGVISMLRQVINETELMEQKGQNALKLSSEYDWNRIAARSHNIYKGILERQNKDN